MKITVNCTKRLLAAAVVGICMGMAQAATNYIVPWYVNPAAKVKLWTGVDAFRAVDLRFGETGDHLFATVNTANGGRAIAYDMAQISSLSGVQTNWHNGLMSVSSAFPAATRVAVSSARNAYLTVNPDEGTGSEAPAGHAQWIGRFAPTQVSFGGAIPAMSFGFDAAGATLWSNCTTSGDEGKLVKWTCSNGTFSSVGTVDSGLTTVEAVALYTVNGTEYVVAGGNGTVKFINAANGTVKFTVNDVTHLGTAIKAVRMSHCDYFRPRLYVLLANGDIAAYYLNRELTKATWSKTNSNATLLTAAGAPFAAESATVVAFDVTPDGGMAAIGYAQNADDESTPTGPAYLTLLKHEPRKWILYEPTDAGNPHPECECLSDGVWNLKCHWGNSGDVYVGVSGSGGASQRAWLDDEFHEYLDFSHGYCYKASNNEKHSINGNEQYAFMTNALGKGPRVLVHSPTMTSFSDKAKHWSGAGNYEEIVIDGEAALTTMSSWSGPGTNTYRVVYNFAKLSIMPTCMIYLNTGKHYGAESRWEDQNMASATKIGYRTWMFLDAKGVLDVPKATSLSNQCFNSCLYMTEAKIGYQANSLKEIYASAFAGSKALKRVTLGGAAGFTIKAANVFNSCPLEEVTFTGAVPTFTSTGVCWPDTAEKTVVFAVPRNAADWDAILSNPEKVKNRLSLAEQQAYRLANPDKAVPIGVLDKSVLQTKFDQYIAYNDTKGGVALTIERDTFFDDQVTVTSDWAPAPDGTYLPGTKVTLKVQPNATGTFVKWYGDVDRAVETNTEITITLNEDAWLYCRVVHPWTLSSDKKRLTNGNFTLNCGVQIESAKTLYVAGWSKYALFNSADVGQGVVDLGGPVTKEDDQSKWTITKTADSSGSMVGKRSAQGGGATSLIFPGTLITTPSGQWIHTTTIDQFGNPYRTLIMDEPEITGNPFPSWSTCGHFNLDRFILRIPKATLLDGNPSFWSISAEKSKFDWWDLSSVKYIAYRTLVGYDWNARLHLSGNLTLPSLCSVTNNALQSLTYVKEISLGGLDKTKTVTRLFPNALRFNPNLCKLTMYNDKDLVVDSVFNSAAETPKEIVLTGRVATNDIFSNLLNKITAAEAKPVRVYVSSAMGWGNRPSYLDAPTEAERAEAPGEFVIGVYRGGAAAPNGKALVIHRQGPFDPRGTYLHFR